MHEQIPLHQLGVHQVGTGKRFFVDYHRFFVPDGSDPFAAPVQIMNYQMSLRWESFQQTFACRIFLADFRNDIDAVQFIFRQLALDIEAADGFYLIPEKVDTIGKLERIGEYVEDTTTDGILSRFVNIIDLFKAIAVEYVCDEHIVEFLSRMNL